MTTADATDATAVAERPKLIRTYRTRAYLHRAGHLHLDDVALSSKIKYVD